MSLLGAFEGVAAPGVIEQLHGIGARLKGLSVVHVNSTRVGGGVAEILHRMVPLMQELGLETRWEVIEGEGAFFDATKTFHNGIQGDPVELSPALMDAYRATNEANAERLRPILEAADIVVIHDPQPAPLLALCPGRGGRWIWRCHIDAGSAHPPLWATLEEFVAGYDASIFHMEEFRRPMVHRQVLMPPSIDPLGPKNCALDSARVRSILVGQGIDPERPMVLQVSRYDRFKDPVGVIRAATLAREATDLQIVLAGGGADDDPEGKEVLDEVRAAAAELDDAHVLLLPPDAHEIINGLQRGAAVILQKSLKEGFGLTVSEAMWKSRPVIGGNVGGIRLQITDGETGYLVDSVEAAAQRITDLLTDPEAAQEMARRGKEHVRAHFLITTHLQNYLELFESLL
ncbi:MAG: glycosyltransferase [Pseudomonadota bacterium]